MSEQPIGEVFYLKSLAGLLAGFKPPREPFDPAGAWKQTWRVCTIIANGAFCGTLTLERAPLEGARFRLGVESLLVQDGPGTLRSQAGVECRADALATPLNFTLNSRTLDAAGRPVEGTEWSLEGGARDGKWMAGRRALPLGGAHALNWGLFDAVQRLPGGKADPLNFDLIKDFDELKPGQRLAWRESLTVLLGAEKLALEAWQLTGEGTLPTIYYRDAAGRLLFVVSGLEGYILNSFAAGREAGS